MKSMSHKHLHRILTLCLLTCLAAFALLAQDYKSLLGQWNMTSETDGDPVHWSLVLKEVDGKLAASLVAGDKEMPAKEFSYREGVMKFKVPYQDEEYDLELKADGPGSWVLGVVGMAQGLAGALF